MAARCPLWPRSRHLWAATWVLLLGASLGGCGDPGAPVLTFTGPTMGTFYSVKVARPPADLMENDLRGQIEAALTEVIAEISTYESDSELSRLNSNPDTEWVPVSIHLRSLIATGLGLSALSGGAFDITVGPLVNLWGFGPERRAEGVPDEDEIAAARERVGSHKLRLRTEPPAIKRTRGDLYIDLSALGEGYGAERVAAVLDAEGVNHYMVAIAGAIRVKGQNPSREPWAIAIEEPTPGRRTVHRILTITDGALATSGDYRNFFEEGGQRYSHAIDPRTGRPVYHRLASVTVIGTDAIQADGLATALMVMGDEKGPELAAAEGIAAYFIIREDGGFRVMATPAFQPYLAD